MDVTLVSIIGSAILVLIALTMGVKKILDALVSSSKKQQKLEEFFQNALLKNQDSIKALIEEKNAEFMQKFLNDFVANTAAINQKLDGFLGVQDKNIINIKSKLENHFLNIVQLVNNLRLDNLINVSNEIGKYKQGIYEDSHFLQEVGHCKIIKLTDKNSGEVTTVCYDENGEKSYAETFAANNTLKYIMKYENGKLTNGIELNKDGEVLFEYIYDVAEEIAKKIEYIYDEHAKLTEKKETNY